MPEPVRVDLVYAGSVAEPAHNAADLVPLKRPAMVGDEEVRALVRLF
jgi:hypothetical protein